MAVSIDLNCDLGESFGVYELGNDTAVLKEITSANVACGYHAGDHNVMAKTVERSVANGVALGAHPGFLDLMGFGRRAMQVEPPEIYHLIIYQINALLGFCQLYHTSMQHVKPHGALYQMAATDEHVADAIAKAVYDTNPQLILFGLAGSELVKAGKRLGLNVAQEVFADRTYQPDGTLTPRSEPNAMIHQPEAAVQQVKQMMTKETCTAVDGTVISLKADTICVHGDNPQSLDFTRQLKNVLKAEGVSLKSFSPV
ncbi:LamB/YcsF family protein [Salibacterium salarium]|uniref:5-oxoprolinase subunit A n=1 Tax=Salibacterium salarium TaxID=284579 RepID=A0A3R9QUX0_9BACI|nr:5-oxoprolinase subunit PxpA [Salibacterium salarium]RSL33977.1 LamB/YcsF family protein [Salibacterium salarium]